MKKFLKVLIITFSLLFLTSCTQTRWEEFPTSLVTNATFYNFNDDYNNYAFYVYINIPNEVFEEADGLDITLNIEVYLDAYYYDYNESQYRTIEDIPLCAQITKPGREKYKVEFNLSVFLNDPDFKGQIMSVSVDSAVYSISVNVNDGYIGYPNMSTDILLKFGLAIMISFGIYVLIVVVLGVIVNKNLTKKYKRKEQ
jgi:hypothetical protein